MLHIRATGIFGGRGGARRRLFLLAGLLVPAVCATAEGKDAAVKKHPDGERLAPVLPPHFYAVPGVEMNVYFDNVVLTRRPERFRFEVECPIGRVEARRWTAVPTAGDGGRHPFILRVTDAGGRDLGTARSTLCVAPAAAGVGASLRILLVGDSLTHATVYPNVLARLLAKPGNPRWTMLGTHRPRNAAPGVAHEGYGGWTWQRFLEHYEPNPDGTYKKRSSPFIFLDPASRKPALDLSRYFTEFTGGTPPDVTVFLLGINDCFTVNPDDPAAVDGRIDTMLKKADALLAAFHAAAPHCLLGVCLTPPPNARESGFDANYKGKYHRWGWKRIQFRLVERMLDHFKGREKARIVLVPTELNLDPVNGFPTNNGVHPNAFGYSQIAASLYAWLKWQLAAGAVR